MQKTRKHKRYVFVPMLLAFVTLALDTVLWGVEDGRGKGRTVANQEQTRIPHDIYIIYILHTGHLFNLWTNYSDVNNVVIPGRCGL